MSISERCIPSENEPQNLCENCKPSPQEGFSKCGLHNNVGPIFLVRAVGAGVVPDDGIDLGTASDVDGVLGGWEYCSWVGHNHVVAKNPVGWFEKAAGVGR